MARNILLVIFTVLFQLAVFPWAVASTRLALVIGNSRYQDAIPLRNPENDVNVVSKALELVGFKVKRYTDLTLGGMRRALVEFGQEAARSQRGEVLIYFAGHGVQIRDENYLLPVDVKVSDLSSLAS